MITIKNLKKINKKGLIAVFDVDVNGVEARKCKLTQFKGEYSICGPAEKYFSKQENKDKYYDLIRFSDDIKNSILDKVMALSDIAIHLGFEHSQESKTQPPADDDIPF